MKRFLRLNGLSVFFLALFLAAVAAQALVGHGEVNNEQLAHQGDPVSLGRYVVSSQFGVDLLENWQSEYLQFTLFILATVWLLQVDPRNRRNSTRRGSSPTPTRRSGATPPTTRRAGRASAAGGRSFTRTRC